MKKIIAAVLLVVGAFFAFAPHTTHVSFGLTSPHEVHVTIGVVLLVAGGWLFMKSSRKSAVK